MYSIPGKLFFIIKYLLIFTLVIFLAVYLLSYISQVINAPASHISYGVTFSQIAAEHLGLDWKAVYKDILDDLKVKNIRLPSYWNLIEETEGEYYFTDTDFLLNEASKKGAKVIMVVGIKQPRWPECHLPEWAEKLSREDRQKKALELITKIIERYKNNPAIVAWQVENEPLLYFFADHCGKPDLNFLKQEVFLVRSLDSRPVIISESGELSFWDKQMQLSDIFGTTLYRTVWNPVFGFTTHPMPPGFYSLRSNFFRKIFAPGNLKTIIVELQAEPWLPSNNPSNTPVTDQIKIFPLSKMKGNIDFANKTGFDEIYLWGVEWWYFMKEKGHPQYWDFARQLFNLSESI